MSTPEPLEEFFAQFAGLGFGYRSSTTAHSNLERLGKESGWDKDSDEWKAARKRFGDALVKQFNFIFGTDNDLESWQKLCAFIDITPIPDTIKECRSLVWDAHVNIVDMLECARTGEKVHKFATLEELSVYTMSDETKMFPKKRAYAEGLLKDLLREIINPYYGRRRNGSEKRKRRKARKQAAAAQAQSS